MQQLLDRFGKLPTSTKILILMVILGVMVIFYMAIPGVSPYMRVASRIDQLEQKKAELVSERDRKQKKADNLDTYKEKVAQLEAELERAKQELPDEREIDDLLKRVDTLARKIGLIWQSFEPQAEQPGNESFYARIPVKFTITGDYHSIAVFFSKVGNMKRIVNIEDISMKSPKEENGKIMLTVSGMAVTFRFLEGSG